MGAKQQLLGLADDRLPPIMIFGPRRRDVLTSGTSSRAGDEAGGMLPLPLHTHSLGAGLPVSPLPSHRQSKPRGLPAGSLPPGRCEPAAVPLAAASRPTTVTGSIPGGHRSLGMAASAHRKGERSSLGVPGCITRLQSRHPRRRSREAAARLRSAAGSPQGSAPVGSGREKGSLARGDSPN